MAGYFIGMHRYLHMIKEFLATVSSAEFNDMALNSKLSKVLSYIQLAGELLQIRYPKITVMCGVEHTVSLFFNYVSKIPVVIVLISAEETVARSAFLMRKYLCIPMKYPAILV